MNSKRLWAATATFLALSVFDPRGSGVWAQMEPMAVCGQGFDWVRLFYFLCIFHFGALKTGRMSVLWALTLGLYAL
jgi:hypothetical protein